MCCSRSVAAESSTLVESNDAANELTAAAPAVNGTTTAGLTLNAVSDVNNTRKPS